LLAMAQVSSEMQKIIIELSKRWVKKECKILIKAPKNKIEDSKQRTKSENRGKFILENRKTDTNSKGWSQPRVMLRKSRQFHIVIKCGLDRDLCWRLSRLHVFPMLNWFHTVNNTSW
jgi:hypothetical protein